jgi:hypothetical protein
MPIAPNQGCVDECLVFLKGLRLVFEVPVASRLHYLQTGDKWRHLPDMRSSLVAPHNNVLYFVLVVAAALSVLWPCVLASRREGARWDGIFFSAACVAVMATLAYRLDDAGLASTRYLLGFSPRLNT